MSDSYVNIFDPSRLLVEVHSEPPSAIRALAVGWAFLSGGSTPIGGPISCSPTVGNPCGNLRYGSGWKELFLLIGALNLNAHRYWSGSGIWHSLSTELPVLTAVEPQEIRQEWGPWEVPHTGSAGESTGVTEVETTIEVGGGSSAGGALSPEMPSIPSLGPWVTGSQVALTHKYDQYAGGSWCRFDSIFTGGHETRCFAPQGSLGGLVEGTVDFGALRIGPYKGVDEWVVHSIAKFSEEHGLLLLVPKPEEE